MHKINTITHSLNSLMYRLCAFINLINHDQFFILQTTHFDMPPTSQIFFSQTQFSDYFLNSYVCLIFFFLTFWLLSRFEWEVNWWKQQQNHGNIKFFCVTELPIKCQGILDILNFIICTTFWRNSKYSCKFSLYTHMYNRKGCMCCNHCIFLTYTHA